MRRALIAAIILAAACRPVAAHVQHVPPSAASRIVRSFSIEAGTGRVVILDRVAANIFVADPKVVEVRPASTRSLFVFGLKAGHTTLAALDSTGRTVAFYDVVVGENDSEARVINRAVAALPGPPSAVAVSPAIAGVTLTGTVTNPAQAERAMTLAAMNLSSSHKAENAMVVGSSATVGLKVRITEMTRQVTRDLGIDWTAIGTIGKYALGFATTNGVSSTIASVYSNKGLSVDTVIEALATDNLVHVLAEPNLTARSGESASFLVGGEYPIPIAQSASGSNNTISVDYKQYGVSLSFVPTVLSSGRISLHVRPEVSELATSASSGAITLAEGNGSLAIPALTVRRAETTLELGSGESFAIAGLLQDTSTQANSFTPGLGELPILGALFRSDSYQHNQTELVIIVTPYIVGSSGDPDALQDADAGFRPPNDLERVLLLRQRGRGRTTPVPGDAGFIVR